MGRRRGVARLATVVSLSGLFCPAFAEDSPAKFGILTVTATAYNSLEAQTDSDPDVAAWGDRLKPGMKVVAISRDLLGRGLTRNSKVRIPGLPGEYLVLDRMHSRWENRIDIYMGEDVHAARRWGARRVRIAWSSI